MSSAFGVPRLNGAGRGVHRAGVVARAAAERREPAAGVEDVAGAGQGQHRVAGAGVEARGHTAGRVNRGQVCACGATGVRKEAADVDRGAIGRGQQGANRAVGAGTPRRHRVRRRVERGQVRARCAQEGRELTAGIERRAKCRQAEHHAVRARRRRRQQCAVARSEGRQVLACRGKAATDAAAGMRELAARIERGADQCQGHDPPVHSAGPRRVDATVTEDVDNLRATLGADQREVAADEPAAGAVGNHRVDVAVHAGSAEGAVARDRRDDREAADQVVPGRHGVETPADERHIPGPRHGVHGAAERPVQRVTARVRCGCAAAVAANAHTISAAAVDSHHRLTPIWPPRVVSRGDLARKSGRGVPDA